jgi:hypothetical protein
MRYPDLVDAVQQVQGQLAKLQSGIQFLLAAHTASPAGKITHGTVPSVLATLGEAPVAEDSVSRETSPVKDQVLFDGNPEDIALVLDEPPF